jgi:uncharacterized protein (DUF1501 family)
MGRTVCNAPVLSRREMFRLSALGLAGVSASGWMGALAAAPAARRVRKSCILLWLDGGPSQHETWDPKPDAPAEYRGEFGAIDTSVPGIRVCDRFPLFSRQMHHCAVVRGMNTGESEHGRARQYLHTGYKTGTAGLDYPTMGSLATAAAKAEQTEMPNFVVTGMHLNPANWSYVSSPGHLGPRHAPLIVGDPKVGVPNLRPTTGPDELADRAALLDQMTGSFLRDRPAPAAQAQAAAYERAVALMRSPKAKAFDLALEPAKARETYGDHTFGQGCLLARRLVEAEVPFVEVYHSPTAGGWDIHTPARVEEVKKLAQPQFDQGAAALLADLKDRGLLEHTLVIVMGEFGRSPKVQAKGGRDHYGKAWSLLMAGGGIKGGQVVGRTDAQGGTVEDRPVSAVDFMATVCRLLGVAPDAEFQIGDRPVRVVDKGAKPMEEIL